MDSSPGRGRFRCGSSLPSLLPSSSWATTTKSLPRASSLIITETEKESKKKNCCHKVKQSKEQRGGRLGPHDSLSLSLLSLTIDLMAGHTVSSPHARTAGSQRQRLHVLPANRELTVCLNRNVHGPVFPVSEGVIIFFFCPTSGPLEQEVGLRQGLEGEPGGRR